MLDLLSNIITYWYFIVAAFVGVFILSFVPILQPFLSPIMGVLGKGFAWVLNQIGITLEVGVPDIMSPARTLILVILIALSSFFGGYHYHKVTKGVKECPAVSAQVRRDYILTKRPKTTATAKVKNWFGF